MRYPDEPLVGLIKDCDTTLWALEYPRLRNDDNGIGEQGGKVISFTESDATERKDWWCAIIATSSRR
jgi:hypothetical protein